MDTEPVLDYVAVLQRTCSFGPGGPGILLLT